MLQLCLYEFFLEENLSPISQQFLFEQLPYLVIYIIDTLTQHHIYSTGNKFECLCCWSMYCGTFTFCHDSVWSVLVDALKPFLYFNKVNNAQRNNPITFVKGGAKLSKYIKMPHPGMLHLTADWKLLSDLGEKWVFHSFIGINCLRPNRHCSLLPLRL